jgi:hypothetical protein
MRLCACARVRREMNGVPTVHKGPVLGCDWSADESRVLSCGEDGTTRSFLANGSLQCAVPLPTPCQTLLYHPIQSAS